MEQPVLSTYFPIVRNKAFPLYQEVLDFFRIAIGEESIEYEKLHSVSEGKIVRLNKEERIMETFPKPVYKTFNAESQEENKLIFDRAFKEYCISKDGNKDNEIIPKDEEENFIKGWENIKTWGGEKYHKQFREIYKKKFTEIKEELSNLKSGNYSANAILYIDSFLNYLNNYLKASQDKWQALHDGLVKDGYIEANENFFQAMEECHLPNSNKIVWIGTKAAGVYFCDFYKFKLPEFNKCFIPKDGKAFAHNNMSKTDPKQEFIKLLEENKR
jgi:hypothetical protein